MFSLCILVYYNLGNDTYTSPSHKTHWGGTQCVGLTLRKMLDLQHQYNNCTTILHMRVGPTYWGPPSCEGLLYNCCIGVVQESNPLL
jgi:hypothetical protein